ncbi:MAG: hypothetical protein C0473_00460 [Cyanobacteria bacterium DS3.002]|nr:hypothetical protein [Cyanobacteria bacterium DS3.002]MBA4049965.1 hypothetical protein [Cyanobacteria bacterium DS2.008]
MVNDIKDVDGFIKMVTCAAQAEEAVENEDWATAIEQFKEALEHFPPELDKRNPGTRSEMLKTIGNFYLLLDKPEEAEQYFAQSVKSLVNSPGFKETEEYVEPFFDVPVRDLPFKVKGLPYIDEPYNGLVVPDELPFLQHAVHMLRPHGINVHAWMYEAIVTMGEEVDETAHKILPGYLPPSEVERLSRPRKYNPDEAVMMRGKDGCMYKLEAPGKLTKVTAGKKPKPSRSKRKRR